MLTAQMLRVACVETQVLYAIVQLVAVDMVDTLFRPKPPTNMAFHNQPMFQDNPPLIAIPYAQAAVPRRSEPNITITAIARYSLKRGHPTRIRTKPIRAVDSLAETRKLQSTFLTRKQARPLTTHRAT